MLNGYLFFSFSPLLIIVMGCRLYIYKIASKYSIGLFGGAGGIFYILDEEGEKDHKKQSDNH